MNNTSYSVSAYLDISSMIPNTPQTNFNIEAFLNKENNLNYLQLENTKDYRQFITVNSGSAITDVLLYSNPSINNPSNFLSSPNLSQVSLSITDSLSPGEQAIADLFPGAIYLASAVIDPTGRYAYFGAQGFVDRRLMFTSPDIPSRIIKVDLLTLSVVGRIRLDANMREQIGKIALMDPFGTYAYFAGRDTNNIVSGISKLFKIDLATFTIFTIIPLPAYAKVEDGCGVIDPSGEFAYFGSGANTDTQTRVFKINLITGVTQSITLIPETEFRFKCVAMDSKGKFAYFGMFTLEPYIVKIDLTTFTRVGSISLSPGEDYLHTASIDPADRYAYFGTDTVPGRIIKIDLQTFTRVGSIILTPGPTPFNGENSLSTSMIDPLGKYIYYSTFTDPGNVIKVDLDTFSVVSKISFNDPITCSVMDPVGYSAYFGDWGENSILTQVKLSSFVVENSSVLPKGFSSFLSSCIDSKNVFVYFGTGADGGLGLTGNARIVRIDTRTLTVVNYVEFDYGLTYQVPSVSCMAIDPTNGRYLYAGINIGDFETSYMIKVDLVTFTRVNSISLPLDMPITVLIDKDGKYAYFGTMGRTISPGGRIFKIDLATFTQVDVLTLNSDEKIGTAVMNPDEQYAYFGTRSFPGKIIRVDLTTFTRVDSLTLNSGEDVITSLLMNPRTLIAFVGLSTYPGKIVKVNLESMQRLAVLVLNASEGENYLRSAVMSSNLRYAFFSSEFFTKCKIIKIDLVRFVRDSSTYFESLACHTAITSPDNPYMYFGSLDGYVIQLPTASEYILSGISGNTPGNLINTITNAEIDFRSQIVQQQRNQQSIVPYYFLLRINGQTGSEPSNDPFVLHTRFKVYPK
jgi:hypothetical protein